MDLNRLGRDRGATVCSQLLPALRFNVEVKDANHSAHKPGWIRIVIVGRRPKATLVRIAFLIAVCFVTFKFILLPIRVEGISMQPTYHDHQVNCVNRLAYLFHEPRRGDVVSIRLAGNSEMLMKRIIGLPGENVSFHDGHAYINGQLLDEPYVKLTSDWESAPIRCGPDQYYVVGDNRSMPFDSHTQGRASRDRIVGRLLK